MTDQEDLWNAIAGLIERIEAIESLYKQRTDAEIEAHPLTGGKPLVFPVGYGRYAQLDPAPSEPTPYMGFAGCQHEALPGTLLCSKCGDYMGNKEEAAAALDLPPEAWLELLRRSKEPVVPAPPVNQPHSVGDSGKSAGGAASLAPSPAASAAQSYAGFPIVADPSVPAGHFKIVPAASAACEHYALPGRPGICHLCGMWLHTPFATPPPPTPDRFDVRTAVPPPPKPVERPSDLDEEWEAHWFVSREWSDGEESGNWRDHHFELAEQERLYALHLESTSRALEAERDEWRDRHERLTAGYQQLERERERLRSCYDMLETKCDEALQRAESAERERDGFRASLGECEMQRDDAAAARDALQQKNAALTAERDQLSAGLTDAYAELSRAQAGSVTRAVALEAMRTLCTKDGVRGASESIDQCCARLLTNANQSAAAPRAAETERDSGRSS